MICLLITPAKIYFMANNNNDKVFWVLGLAAAAVYFFTKKKKLVSTVHADYPTVLTQQQYYQPIKSTTPNSTINTINTLVSSGMNLINAIKGAGGTNINVQPSSNAVPSYHHGPDDDIGGMPEKTISFFKDGKTYVLHLKQ